MIDCEMILTREAIAQTGAAIIDDSGQSHSYLSHDVVCVHVLGACRWGQNFSALAWDH